MRWLALWFCTLWACSGSTDTTSISTGATGGASPTGCPTGQTECDGDCVNVSINESHCGTCGFACAAGELCLAGNCELSCGGGTTDCGGYCADTDVDIGNCGACGTSCPADQVCSNGQCALSCSGGTTECDGGCVDTDYNPQHCGACGVACPPAKVCTGGGCCSLGEQYCGNACTNLLDDPTNCGACGTVCSDMTPSCLGGQCVAILADCAAYIAADANSSDGVYTIDPDGMGGRDSFDVFCDMTKDGGGWTMVFKISAGVDGDANALWTGAAQNDDDATLLDTAKATKHYVSRLLQGWNNGFTVTEARAAVYEAGAEQRYFRFNASGSTKTDWFTKANLSASSYIDIQTQNQNYFAIGGDASNGRFWFINRNYGGCGADSGWLVLDSAPDPCSWETGSGNAIRIIYSKLVAYVSYQQGMQSNHTGSADAFAVFVR